MSARAERQSYHGLNEPVELPAALPFAFGVSGVQIAGCASDVSPTSQGEAVLHTASLQPSGSCRLGEVAAPVFLADGPAADNTAPLTPPPKFVGARDQPALGRWQTHRGQGGARGRRPMKYIGFLQQGQGGSALGVAGVGGGAGLSSSARTRANRSLAAGLNQPKERTR